MDEGEALTIVVAISIVIGMLIVGIILSFLSFDFADSNMKTIFITEIIMLGIMGISVWKIGGDAGW